MNRKNLNKSEPGEQQSSISVSEKRRCASSFGVCVNGAKQEVNLVLSNCAISQGRRQVSKIRSSSSSKGMSKAEDTENGIDSKRRH